MRDQDAPDARNIVAGIECVPLAAKIRLEPSGEIHRAVRRLHPDLAEIARAIARRNIHAAAKRDGKMRVVAAYAFAFLEGLERGFRNRELVAEGDVVVHKVADRLHAIPSRRRMAEQFPRIFGQAIRLAVAAAQKKQDGLGRQVFDRVLPGRPYDGVRHPCIFHETVGGQLDLAFGRHNAAAPVAKIVAIGRDRHSRGRH